MAVYRLHRREWETEHGGAHSWRSSVPPKTKTKTKTHPADRAPDPTPDGQEGEEEEEERAESARFEGGGRGGVSSGLSTVVVRHGTPKAKAKGQAGKTKAAAGQWWLELGGGGGGPKGSVRVRAGGRDKGVE